ncbi:LysM peptidoglycan-binding domain-containing protein, partial [Proteiniborus sp.]
YVVKPGDVLWKIAKQFGLVWEKLAEFNNLKNPHLIFPGQEILIPAN